ATPVRAREKRAAIAGPYPRIRKECRGNYPRRRTQATRTLLLFRAEGWGGLRLLWQLRHRDSHVATRLSDHPQCVCIEFYTSKAQSLYREIDLHAVADLLKFTKCRRYLRLCISRERLQIELSAVSKRRL